METNNTDIPLGLGMALMQHAEAMNYFFSLPEKEQRQIISHTHTIGSREEMQAYVQSLIKNNNSQ